MAQRRMFSKSITNSSQFLMMPSSSQNLYFHLGMNADDDGFCEHFSLMRMTDSKPDDLKVLQARGFVSVFDDKVLVITDWKENNYLRSDRYTPSKYLDIYKDELHQLSIGIPNGIPEVDKVATQVRLGKDRIGKNTSKEKIPFSQDGADIIKAFEEVDVKNKTYYNNKTERAAADFLIKEYKKEFVEKVIAILPKTNKLNYIPAITKPSELKEKWVKLRDALEKAKTKDIKKPNFY